MGVENNEAIIATTANDKCVTKAKEWVEKLPKEQQSLFVFVPSLVNAKTTILLAPDGSKKGWATANETEKLRADFIKLLESFRYEDGSNPFDYVEVGYGEYGQKVLKGNCLNCYNDKEYAI